MRNTGFHAGAESKQRIIESKQERIEALRKRVERNDQTQSNHALVVAEQERLVEQLEQIRADVMASKNAATMSARIDATVEQLDQTNRWIAQLDEFKQLLGEIPGGESCETNGRDHRAAAAPAPLPVRAAPMCPR